MKDFERFYEECRRFYANDENCKKKIPQNYVVGDYKLGMIAFRICYGYIHLTFEQVNLLDEIGFVWYAHVNHPKLSFEEMYQLLQQYVEKKHQNYVPYNYKTQDGIALGQVFYTFRKGMREMTEEQRKKIETLGISLAIKERKVIEVEDIIRMLEEYRAEYHNLLVPVKYVTPKQEHLGNYVRSIRRGYKEVTPEQRKRLDEMGFVWKVSY